MNAAQMKNVAIIGAGLMGHGIAQVFAAGGFSVTLVDLERHILSAAMEKIRDHIECMAQMGISNPDEIGSILERIRTTQDMREATSEVHFVLEAVPENLELKQKLFAELDSLCSPNAILATNTSVISISAIAQEARLPERIVGTHFWNPPYLIPLVEVVRAERTSLQVMETTMEIMRRIGKHPVWVKKDVAGFIGNRLQHALWREAISIVENGIADPKTVDEVVKNGFGIRLPVLGPMENADMVGLDLTLAIHDYLLKYLERSKEASPLLKNKVKLGELGFKAGRGFYPWSCHQIEESRKNLEAHLLEWIKKRMSGDQEGIAAFHHP